MKKLTFEKIIAESGDRFKVFLDKEELGISSRKEIAEIRMEEHNFEVIKQLHFNKIPSSIEILYFIEKNIPPKYKIPFFNIDSLNLSREWGFPQIFISLVIDFPNWSLDLTPNDFTNHFAREIQKIENLAFTKNDSPNREGVPYEFYITKKMDSFKVIENELDITFDIINGIINEISKKYNNKKEGVSVETFFSFPEEYKSACEQYLIYFATFLKDLGIEVNTDLENQENGVLFKVFPKDKEAALSQIKEALDVYLALPVQQNLEIVANNFQDASVQQLMSNVYHLKSQLMLAQSTLQMKNATITSLELSNYQLKQIVDKYEVQTKDEEQILGGNVTIKEYDGNGLKINLPELFRLLKRKIWGK